jgi:exonuclease III
MKDELMREFITKNRVDITCITETNVHWGKVPKKDNWYERSSGWFESRRLAVSYHQKRGRLATKNQYGGTMTLAKDDISHRAIESGYDSSGMGRWSFIRFRGKRKNVTRIFTCYCPNKSTTGANTVYSQQLQTLGRDPIAAFWTDLATEVLVCQQKGEQVVLLGDWNTDSQDKTFVKWKKRLGLIDPLERRHGKKGPSTFNRGKRVIDSILVSSMLQTLDCGYLSFGLLPGDHRGIWLDITKNSFIGYRAPAIPSFAARRLKLDDPRVTSRYLTILEDELVEARVFPRLRKLQRDVQAAGHFHPHHVTK